MIRTRYLLQWISGPALRSEVTAGTNEVEAYHALTEWLRFGLEGVIQENAPEEQQTRVRYTGLLALALIFWTVVEMAQVLDHLSPEGNPQKKDLAYLSSHHTRHIKRFAD